MVSEYGKKKFYFENFLIGKKVIIFLYCVLEVSIKKCSYKIIIILVPMGKFFLIKKN